MNLSSIYCVATAKSDINLCSIYCVITGKLDMSSSRPQLCVKQSQLYGRSMELLMEGLQDDLAITTEIKQKLATFGFSGQSNEQVC